MELDIENYKQEISRLIQGGYKFYSFEEFFNSPSERKSIILRHDIDFCLTSALIIAKIDADFKIKSAFFFQLRSPLYNLFSNYALEIIREIYSLGHSVGLHYDFLFYNTTNFESLESEMTMFENLYPFMDKKFVSFHRTKLTLEQLEAIKLPNNIRHTYDPFLFRYLKYYSDSKGILGDFPSKTEVFQQGISMQLLFHPIWWTQQGKSPIEKVKSFLTQNREQTIKNIESSAISFKLENL